MKILILDNYDSFTYNIVRLVREITLNEPDVKRNDCLTIDEIATYDGIILSPGPGIPSEAGLLLDVIKIYGSSKRILGVCLGHQAIGEVYGAKLVNMSNVLHGVASNVIICVDDPLFNSLPNIIEVGHYHSWIIDRENFPDNTLEVTVEDQKGHIMGIRHKTYDVKGVQFHPESILTPLGYNIITNWINDKV